MARLNKRRKRQQKFFKRCPNGGVCANPLCMMGCIDKW